MSLFPIISPVNAPPELLFLQQTESTSNQTTYSFSSQSFGDARSDREILVTIAATGNAAVRAISAATIGGVSADIHKQVNDSSPANPFFAGIISAPVPMGTSGTVSITFSGGCLKCGIAMYRAIRLASRTAHATAFDTDDVLSMSLNIKSGGFAVGVAHFGNESTNIVTTGLANEDYEATFETFSRRIHASESGMSKETGRSIQFNGGGTNAAGACASWR